MLSTITTLRQVFVSTIILSALITLLSLGLSALLHYIANGQMGTIGILASVFVPGVIAPLALYKFLSLIRTLNLTRTQLEATSREDYLTGIFNRRYVEESAQRTFSLSKRHGFPVSIMMLDLDHFKKVNDTHGHAVGDVVLIELTKCIGKIIRKTDIFGRFGGEEFILFMPHTTLDQATFLAERIRTETASLQIKKGDIQLSVTVSLGVAVADEDTKTIDALIINADGALYEAKRNGRNRVEVFDKALHNN